MRTIALAAIFFAASSLAQLPSTGNEREFRDLGPPTEVRVYPDGGGADYRSKAVVGFKVCSGWRAYKIPNGDLMIVCPTADVKPPYGAVELVPATSARSS